MTLPNFLIVGAAKSGTTSLNYYLDQHPEIGMLPEKEANYFIEHRWRPNTLEEYEAMFACCEGKKAVGESPARCLYDPDAPRKIKKTLPGVKIIIILRNPADMAHSLWGHLVRNGEKLSFKAALAKEPKRLSDPLFKTSSNNWHGDYYYFHRALYYEQVKRYIDLFGREMVKVLIFDDFKKDPVAACREIFQYLGVKPDFAPVIERHNTGRVYRHRGFHKLVTQPPSWVKKASSFLPESARKKAQDYLVKLNTKGVPRLDPKIRKTLLDKYAEDIRKLEQLIGRDLSHWLKS
jgi:Sulfotransferase domain